MGLRTYVYDCQAAVTAHVTQDQTGLGVSLFIFLRQDSDSIFLGGKTCF